MIIIISLADNQQPLYIVLLGELGDFVVGPWFGQQ